MQLVLGADPHRVEFEFSLPYTDNLGLLLSGGLDSTALLILIIEHLTEIGRLDHVSISAFTQCKSTQEQFYAVRIVSKIRELYPNVVLVHHNNILNSVGSNRLGRMDLKLVRPVIKQQGLDRVYAAFTNETPAEQKTFEGRLGFTYVESTDIITPFIGLTKHQILEIYSVYNKQQLIPLTHSCSREPLSSCGRCYSCNERAWAFDRLGWTDPGTE